MLCIKLCVLLDKVSNTKNLHHHDAKTYLGIRKLCTQLSVPLLLRINVLCR